MGPDLSSTSLPHQPAVNAPTDKPSFAQTAKTEGVGKAVYASFKQMKSDLTEQISSIAKPVLKTISDNFSEKFTTARDQFVGLVGRFSPSLEQKMRTPEEIELQGSIEEQVANLDTIQSKISEIKKEPRRLLEKSIQEFSKIDEGVALEKKQIDLSIGTSASFIGTQEKDLQATQRELLNASAKLGNMQADDIQTGDRYNPATKKQKEVCERLKEKITSKEKSLEDLKTRYKTLVEGRDAKISDAEEAGKRAKELVKQTYHHDIAKLQGQILDLRREWSAGKGKLEEFKSEVTKSAPSLVHAKEFRKIDSTERKVTTFFSSLGFIGQHDDMQFKITEKRIDDSLKAINSDKINPNSIREHFKTINEGITDLERRMRLAKMSGNEKLAEEIQTKITAIRSNPILAENPSQQLVEQQNEAKKLILSPDFKSASAQAKFKTIQEQSPARLQAIALKAATPQHYATVREVGPRLDPPTESQKEPIHDKTKRVVAEAKNFTAFVKKNPQLIVPAKVLMTSLHEKVGLLKQIQEGTKPQLSESGLRALSDDIQKISDAIRAIESEVIHQEEVKALLDPEKVALRELEHVKQALKDASAGNLKLAVTGTGNDRFLETKERSFGISSSQQGRSDASQAAVTYILNVIAKNSYNPNTFGTAKEIITEMKANPWVKSVLEHGQDDFKDLFDQIELMVDKNVEFAHTDQQLTLASSSLEKTRETPETFVRVRHSSDNISLDMKVKKSTDDKEGEMTISLHRLIQLATDTSSEKINPKSLTIVKQLIQSPWSQELLATDQGAFETILNLLEKGLNSSDKAIQGQAKEILKVIQEANKSFSTNERVTELAKRPIQSPENTPSEPFTTTEFLKNLFNPLTPEFKTTFLRSFGSFISNITNNRDKKVPDSEKLFNFITETFQQSSSLHEKKQLMELALEWTTNPSFNNGEVQGRSNQIDTLIAMARKENSIILNDLCDQLTAAKTHTASTNGVETKNGTTSFVATIDSIAKGDLSEQAYQAAVKEFAQSLTMQNAALFKAINSTEYKNVKWANNPEAPNIQKFIDQFNATSQFAIQCILNPLSNPDSSLTPEQTRALAANVIRFFVDVQKQLVSEDNPVMDISSFMAIQSALRNSAITRMNATMKLLPKETVDAGQEFDKLADPSSAYKAIRQKMKTDHVMVPHIGVYLSDLTFTFEGNQEKVNGGVNAKRIDLFGKAIGIIMDMQEKIPDSTTQITHDIGSLKAKGKYDEAALYQQSLVIDPRAKPAGAA